MSEILAEARVLVLPDTSAFRATLLGELNAIQASVKPIVVPVASTGAAAVAAANTEIVASSAAATAATNTQVVSERARAAAVVKSGAALTQLARAESLGLEAEARLAGVVDVAALRTSQLAKARAILSETSAAVTIAQRALDAALAAGNIALVDATSRTLGLAKAREAEATSAVRATIAENELSAAAAKRAAAQEFATRGAGTGALAMLGLRGATLAANAAFIAGAAAFIAFSKSVGLAAGLQQELNVFRVTAKATSEDLQRVSDTAKQLGADITLPAVSAKDAAEAMTELAKAGLSVQDSIDGARGVLQLATAAQIDNAAATEIAANALNSFGLGGDQALHVADLLANASIEAQGSISDMGAALTAVSSVAKLVGVSLDDTVALITLLAKNGLAGARGGTALKVALLRLVAPSAAAEKIIRRLGITIRDAQGNIRPDVFAQFTEATDKLAPSVAQADAAIVFGTRGIQAAAIAGRSGAEGLNAMQVAVERQGAAADLAGARTAGFSGKIEGLKNAVETLGTTLGGFALGPLGNVADGLTTIAGDAVLATEKMKDFNNSLPGGGGGSTFLGRVFDNLTSGFGDTQRQIEATIKLLKQGEPIKFGEGPTRTLRDLNRQLETTRESVPSVRDNVDKLFAAFQEGGGRSSSTALNEFVLGLEKLATAEEKGLVTNDQLASKIRSLIRELQDPNAFSVDVGVNLDEAGLKNKASQGAAIVLDSLKSSLSPEAAKALGFDFMTNVGAGAVDAAPAAGAKAGQAFKVSLGGELAIAEAAGTSDSALLASLREREARDQAFFDRFNAIPNRTKAQQATLEKAAAKLNEDRAAIQKILDGEAADQRDAASKAKTAADNITKARNEADQNVLDAFTAVLAKPKRLLTRAAGTKPLDDDIKFAKQILGIINTQIKNAAKDIKDAKTRRDTLDRLLTDRLNIQKTISDLVKNRQEAIRKAAEDRRTRLREGLQLDIDFAATKGNVQGEIRAHLRLLVQLQKDLIRVRKQYGKNSNEAKEVRNAIANEQKAIDDLRGTTKGRNDAFSKLTFEFLQTQSGFAANLLGNLIPGGATGGLVGGVAGPSTRGAGGAFPGALLPQEHGRGGSPADDLRKANVMVSGGPSRAGQATTNQLLRDMRALLRHIYAGTGHPEAKHRQKRNLAAMELAGRI